MDSRPSSYPSSSAQQLGNGPGHRFPQASRQRLPETQSQLLTLLHTCLFALCSPPSTGGCCYEARFCVGYYQEKGFQNFEKMSFQEVVSHWQTWQAYSWISVFTSSACAVAYVSSNAKPKSWSSPSGCVCCFALGNAWATQQKARENVKLVVALDTGRASQTKVIAAPQYATRIVYEMIFPSCFTFRA